jgi:hypothetical protein
MSDFEPPSSNSPGYSPSTPTLRIPQEIQDIIIDILVENVPRHRRKEAFGLRLVCQTWIHRVDFHVF